MSILTFLMFIGLNGYLLYRVVQARKFIWRGGPAMVAGIAALLSIVVFGEFPWRFEYFTETMAAGGSLALILIVYALWSRGLR